MATFLASKFAEYEAEMKDATSLQDNQKQFNENYISKEKQLALALEKMLPEEVRDQLKGKVTKTTTTGTTTAGGSYSGTVQEQFWQFFIADGYSNRVVEIVDSRRIKTKWRLRDFFRYLSEIQY